MLNKKNIILKLMAGLIVGLIADKVQAGNLIFNSGFEMGDAGTGLVKFLRSDTNPKQIFEGPTSDTATYTSGSKSLRIPNRFSEKCELFFKEFKLKPGTEYTFSASMKSSVPNCKVTVALASATAQKKFGWDVKIKNFEIDTKWTRKFFSFKTKKPWPNEWYSFKIQFGKAENSLAGIMWLDDIQIVEGKSSFYEPRTGIEAYLKTTRVYYIAEKSKNNTAQADLRVCNNEKTKANVKLLVTAIEDSTGVNVFSKDFTVSLNPGESKDIPFKLPLKRFGAFRLNVNLLDGGKSLTTHPGFTLVAGKYEKKPLDFGKTYCVGLNLGNANYFSSRKENKPGFRCAGRSNDDYMRLLTDMGCRLIRGWSKSGFHWSECEPEESKFDFGDIDVIIDAYKRNGIHLLPLLGHMDFIDSERTQWPKWLKQKCVMLKKSGDWNKIILLPPIDLWKKYIRSVVAHCKGKIKYYEIMNEPNGFMAPEIYIKYLKAADEEIKKADPEAKTVGFCATGDLGGKSGLFLEACFKLGGLKYVDIVSFHPYYAPSLSSFNAADAQIKKIQALIKLYGEGKDIPLWNTELYHLNGHLEGDFEAGKHFPYQVAWRFLTDLGEGVAQGSSLTQSSIFNKMLAPRSMGFYYIWTCMNTPSGDFVVYNALARLFEGAKALAKFKWGNDTVCYVYECNGKYLAAFWNYGTAKELNVQLAASDANAQLYDLYGNPLSLNTQPLKLTALPFYLEWKGESKTTFFNLLRNAKLKADKPVIPSSFVRLLPEKDGWVAAIGLKNYTEKTVNCKLELYSDFIETSQVVDCSLLAKADQTIKVPIKLKTNNAGKIEIKICTNGKQWSFPAEIAPAARVYVAPGKAEPINQSHRKKKKSVHQATFQASYDADNLLLTIDVKDKSPSGAPGSRKPWQQDCVELFVNANPGHLPSKHTAAYHNQVGRLFITPYAPANKQLIIWSKGLKGLTLDKVKLHTEINSEGYTVKLEIPLAALKITHPTKGKYIGFDIQVDDADEDRNAESALTWNSPGIAYKDCNSFGFIKLK